MKKCIAAGVAVVGASVLAAAAAPAPANGAVRGVRVADDVFRPATLTVKAGDRLRFRWVGRNPHNVVVTRGRRRFRSAVKRSGRYRSPRLRRGRYRMVCTIHPGMALRVRARRR